MNARPLVVAATTTRRTIHQNFFKIISFRLKMVSRDSSGMAASHSKFSSYFQANILLQDLRYKPFLELVEPRSVAVH
jgi:hypothetical protein